MRGPQVFSGLLPHGREHTPPRFTTKSRITQVPCRRADFESAEHRLERRSNDSCPRDGGHRRPHPYHGTTRNRCANRRFPRSCPTVRAKVMGSPSAKGCAHFPVTLFASESLPQSAHRTGSVPLPRSAASSGRRHQSAEQYGSSAHRRTAASAAPRTAAPSILRRDGGIPRSGHTQTKVSGPGGGRGRIR
jgi:hypothetical protein